jgi:hypothetical protein
LLTWQGLNIHFEGILNAILETGVLSAGGRSVFVLYAHDDTTKEANSQLVRKLIDWLNKVNVNVLSDRSPFGDHNTAGSFHNDRVGQDILWNQLRLIPKSRYDKSADKVLMCCSKLLMKYYDKCVSDPTGFRYDTEIEAAYQRTQDKYMQEQEMYDEIHEVIQRNPGEDFHHVLTELALIKARKENVDTKEDESDSVIPVLVNGDYGDYSNLPFGDSWTKLSTKLDQSDLLNQFEVTRNEHKLFFTVLRGLNSPEHYSIITEFMTCYLDYAKTMVKDSHGAEVALLQDRLKANSELAIQQARRKMDEVLEKVKEKKKGVS